MPEELPLAETSAPEATASAPAATAAEAVPSAPEVSSEPEAEQAPAAEPSAPVDTAGEVASFQPRLIDAFARVMLAGRSLEHAARIAPSASMRRAEAHLADAEEWLRDAGCAAHLAAQSARAPFVVGGGESFASSLIDGLDGVGASLEDIAYGCDYPEFGWKVGRAAYAVHSGLLHLRAHIRRN